MTKFLSRQEVYAIIQRELPEDAYPQGPPAAFFQTADNDAIAQVFASLYAVLQIIENNNFPQTADEKIADWEIKVFGQLQSSTLTLAQRQQALLQKIRSQIGISIPAMIQLVYQVISSSIHVEIWEWGCETGSWILGESQLGVNTYLGATNRSFTYGADACGKPASAFGLTDQQLLDVREEAYTFEVRIYNYTLSAQERDLMTKVLTAGDPARSAFVITDSLPNSELLNGDT